EMLFVVSSFCVSAWRIIHFMFLSVSLTIGSPEAERNNIRTLHKAFFYKEFIYEEGALTFCQLAN
ncbi:MAG: hypothetical protein PHU34_12095, partial [Candidatus Methanoperedens sp.]|nr:hypothetical protein [Candidatus Methanoperedens sp.]